MQNILFLSSINPITIEQEPSDLTVTFAKSLSSSPQFKVGQRYLEKQKYGLGQKLLYTNLRKNFSDLDFSEEVKTYFRWLPGCNLSEYHGNLSLIDSITLLLYSTPDVSVWE